MSVDLEAKLATHSSSFTPASMHDELLERIKALRSQLRRQIQDLSEAQEVIRQCTDRRARTERVLHEWEQLAEHIFFAAPV